MARADVLLLLTCSFAARPAELAAAPLHKGGDVSETQLLLLHDLPGLQESAQGTWRISACGSLGSAR